LPAQFRAASGTILGDYHSGFFTYINPIRGLLRIVARPSETDGLGEESELGLTADRPPSESVVYETLPPEAWRELSPSVISDPLSRGIKNAYDPQNILNPGILG